MEGKRLYVVIGNEMLMVMTVASNKLKEIVMKEEDEFMQEAVKLGGETR